MDLQSFFRDAVAAQIKELEVAIDLPPDAPEVANARRVAHSLKGSGTTYGYPEISQAAAVTEQASDASFSKSVESLIEVLTKAIETDSKVAVLVVDDDPVFGEMLVAKLSSPLLRVEHVGSRAEAESHLDNSQPQVIVLDLFLPDGDGRDLLAQLVQSRPGLTVIATSATDSNELRDAVMAAGATAFLTKPVNIRALTDLVEQLLRQRAEGRHTRDPLIEVYDDLRRTAPTVTVASIVPELHGPGGLDRRNDSSVLDDMVNALDELLPPDIAIGRWSPTELIGFTDGTSQELLETLDRARLRLRNRLQQPDGSVATFSAGVAPGSSSLLDSYGHAREAASAAAAGGGDRVVLASSTGRANTVLLAEDDPLTAALVVHRLERESLDVTHCTDGLTAIEIASQREFGLIILDIQMPGLDGFGVLAELRQRPAYLETPIIILTAVGSERDVVRGFELGCDDYVLKPFSPAELTARLRRFTRKAV